MPRLDDVVASVAADTNTTIEAATPAVLATLKATGLVVLFGEICRPPYTGPRRASDRKPPHRAGFRRGR